MELEEIVAHLRASHESLMLMARTIAPNAEGDKVGYRFSTPAGGEVPTLDRLAAELETYMRANE